MKLIVETVFESLYHSCRTAIISQRILLP